MLSGPLHVGQGKVRQQFGRLGEVGPSRVEVVDEMLRQGSVVGVGFPHREEVDLQVELQLLERVVIISGGGRQELVQFCKKQIPTTVIEQAEQTLPIGVSSLPLGLNAKELEGFGAACCLEILGD